MFNKMKKGLRYYNGVILLSIAALLITANIAIGSEPTRHITGDGVNIYFMNDKVFGVVNNSPLYAIYNCGTDINGEIDKNGTYINFGFEYLREGEKRIKGAFGNIKIDLGNIEKKDEKIIYHVFINGKEYLFSVRYEKIEREHLVNSIIEGTLDAGRQIRLRVDGNLCPFATTGIILIVSGALLYT